jgi:hypothetical protein
LHWNYHRHFQQDRVLLIVLLICSLM